MIIRNTFFTKDEWEINSKFPAFQLPEKGLPGLEIKESPQLHYNPKKDLNLNH